MDQIFRAAVLAAGFLATWPALAGTWSLGVDAGGAELSGDNESLYDQSFGVRAAWWWLPQYAVEASLLNTDDAVVPDGLSGRIGVEPLRSLALGVRAHWPISERSFLVGRAGIARLHTERNMFVFTSGNSGGTPTTYVSILNVAATDNAPYLGFGIGWKWNDHWHSSVELARSFSELEIECVAGTGICGVDSARFDTATIALTYQFN